MVRSPLHEKNFRPKFSGHETFPLRYGWLNKVYDRVSRIKRNNSESLCWEDDAIADFGVGKNMVSSMRHWSMAADIIEEPKSKKPIITEFGKILLDKRIGLDPYLEHPASLWLIHWKLATTYEKKTTWFWAFSHYPSIFFQRDQLIKQVERFIKDSGWYNVANTTVKNDIACFIRTYVVQSSFTKNDHDDSLESPLTELGLIRPISKRDEFRFVRGPKSTLSDGVFAYALIDFWVQYYSEASTLSFEIIAYGLGAPGRVFLLDENAVVDRLFNIESITKGALRWSETSGLKQVVRNNDIDLSRVTALKCINQDYPSPIPMKVV